MNPHEIVVHVVNRNRVHEMTHYLQYGIVLIFSSLCGDSAISATLR